MLLADSGPALLCGETERIRRKEEKKIMKKGDKSAQKVTFVCCVSVSVYCAGVLTYLEVATAKQQVHCDPLFRFSMLNRFVDVVQLPVATAIILISAKGGKRGRGRDGCVVGKVVFFFLFFIVQDHQHRVRASKSKVEYI